MARRYRYSFTKKKEAGKGKLSVVLSVVSFLLLGTVVLLSLYLEGSYSFVVGGLSLFAALLSVYGFIMGLAGFSEEGKGHKTCIVGAMACGILMIVWIGLYLTGM